MLALVGQASPGATDPLDDARRGRAAARAEVNALVDRLDLLGARYARLEERAARASARLVDLYRADMELDAHLTDAQDTLTDRARALYQVGPAGLLTAFLGAASLGDLHAANQAFESAFTDDVDRIAAVIEGRGELGAMRLGLETDKAELARLHDRLESLRGEMLLALGRAREAARRAGERVAALERRARSVEKAERTAVKTFEPLFSGGIDQDELLALLGPTGGRGCTIPPGLRPTGDGFSGISSWYGWDFAGNPTASGAIYDPRLFTAAHLTLPLPSFLHVRHGDRCATVLVNDRGPYIEGRVLDLSKGAADYLGVGLSHVEAEILAPAG